MNGSVHKQWVKSKKVINAFIYVCSVIAFEVI